MKKCRSESPISVEPLAAVLWGLLIYFSDPRQLLLLLPPVLVHELGHWLCLRACGLRAERLSVEACGLCISYRGGTERWEEILIAAAGPLFGFVYAAIASLIPVHGRLSGGISLLLSIFNLLPIRPLDGGRIAAALLTKRTAAALSVSGAAAVLAVGLFLFVRGGGAALLLAGGVLLAAQPGDGL